MTGEDERRARPSTAPAEPTAHLSLISESCILLDHSAARWTAMTTGAGGWVVSHRRIWENPAFRDRQEAAVYVWAYHAAAWQDGPIDTKFGRIELRRGELLMAEREIAEAFGLGRTALRTLLQRLGEAGMIERCADRAPTRAGTVWRITNYEQYQSVNGCSLDQQAQQVQQRTANQTANQTANPTARQTANQTAKDAAISVGAQALTDDQAGSPDRWENHKPNRYQTANRTANHTKINERLKQEEEAERDAGASEAGGIVAIDGEVIQPCQPITPKSIIRMFDDIRAEVYGETQRRPWPSSTDKTFAERWIVAAGTDTDIADICAQVFRRKCDSNKTNNTSPPGSLKYCDAAIMDAIAENRAIAAQPIELRRMTNGQRTGSTDGRRKSAQEALFDAAFIVHTALGEKD